MEELELSVKPVKSKKAARTVLIYTTVLKLCSINSSNCTAPFSGQCHCVRFHTRFYIHLKCFISFPLMWAAGLSWSCWRQTARPALKRCVSLSRCSGASYQTEPGCSQDFYHVRRFLISMLIQHWQAFHHRLLSETSPVKTEAKCIKPQAISPRQGEKVKRAKINSWTADDYRCVISPPPPQWHSHDPRHDDTVTLQSLSTLSTQDEYEAQTVCQRWPNWIK